MGDQLINEIKSSIEMFKKSRKMDFNCPFHSHSIVELFHEIKDSLTQKIVPLVEIKEILGIYKLVTKDTLFTVEEIKNNIDVFQRVFAKKKEESLLTGKKILVVIGESHEFQESLFFELLISTILKANGFNSALVEYNENGLKKLLDNPSGLINGLNIEFFKNILNMKLVAVDPLHDEDAEDLLNTPRCEAINKAIAKNSQQDQMVVMGALHLKHIMDSKEINDNFIVMPLRVDCTKEKFPIELVEQIPKDILSEEILRLNFHDSVESFSINKLLDVYMNVLPMSVGDEAFSENAIFLSDFSANYAQCKKFDNIPQVIEWLESKFSGLINDSVDEL